MNATTSKCTVCFPSCPDALGYPSSCEIEALYRPKQISKEENDKNIKFLGLFDVAESIDSALDRLKDYKE